MLLIVIPIFQFVGEMKELEHIIENENKLISMQMSGKIKDLNHHNLKTTNINQTLGCM